MFPFNLIRPKNMPANQHGFSVIELIVSASIIAFISALVVVNFRGTNQKQAMANEADRLSSIIRQAHIDTLIGNTINGTRPPGGYGIHLQECQPENCSYIFYANDTNEYYYNSDFIVEEYTLIDDNVYVDDVEYSQAVDFVFVPPKGDIYFYDNSQNAISSETVTITLKYANTDYTHTIRLNRLSGQIEVEQL